MDGGHERKKKSEKSQQVLCESTLGSKIDYQQLTGMESEVHWKSCGIFRPELVQDTADEKN